MIYLLLLLYIIFLVYTIDVKKIRVNKDTHLGILFLLFVVVCGLRYNIGGDTLGYMQSWKYYPALFQYNGIKNPIEVKMCEPEFDRFQLGWITLAMLFKNISNSFFVFQFALSFILNYAIFRTIRKYSEYPFLTLLIFYMNFTFFELEFEVLRESLAVSIFLLFAFDNYIKKRWIRYYLGVIIAYFIHPSAIMMFLLPLLRNIELPIQKYILYVIPIVLFFSIGGRFLLGDLLNVVFNGQEYVTEYVNNAVNKEYNSNYLIMYVYKPTLMTIITIFGCKYLSDKNFAPMTVVTISFLFFSLIYFTASRLANYIIIPVYISLTPLFMHYIQKFNTIWISICFLIIYNVPFIYALIQPERLELYYPYKNILFE